MTLDANNLQVTIFSNINLVRSSTKEAPQFMFFTMPYTVSTQRQQDTKLQMKEIMLCQGKSSNK